MHSHNKQFSFVTVLKYRGIKDNCMQPVMISTLLLRQTAILNCVDQQKLVLLILGFIQFLVIGTVEIYYFSAHFTFSSLTIKNNV